MNISSQDNSPFLTLTSGEILYIKKVSLPPWDMNANVSCTVDSGLPLTTRFVFASCFVGEDAFLQDGIYVHNLCSCNIDTGLMQGSIASISNGSITVVRYNGSVFASIPLFNATDYSRGEVVIGYYLI